MTNVCEGLSLVNKETQTLSNLGSKLKKLHSSLPFNRPEANKELCKREGLEPEETDTELKQDLLEADKTREELSIPIKCPHDTYEDKDKCIYHLKKKDIDGLATEINNRILKEIDSTDDINETSTNEKCFVATHIPRLSLKYEVIESINNKPIDFRFSNIGELNLDHCKVSEKLLFNHSSIKDMTAIDSELIRGIDMRGSIIDSNKISFSNSKINKINLEDTEIYTGRISFNNSVFKGSVSLLNSSINIKTDVAADINKVHIDFKNCLFDRKVNFNGLELSTAETPSKKNTYVKIYFDDSEFKGQSLSLQQTEFGSVDKREKISSENKNNHLKVDELSFDRTEFYSCNITFNNMTLCNDFSFNSVEISGNYLNLTGVTIDGCVDMKGLTMNCQQFSFSNSRIYNELELDRSEFNNAEVINFEKSKINGDISLTDSSINANEINFEKFETEGKFKINNSLINSKNLNMIHMDICGAFSASFTQFNNNQTLFDNSKFKSSFTLNKSDINGRFTFDQTIFKGQKVNLKHIDAVNSELIFNKTRTQPISSSKSELLIDFSHSDIPNANFTQPEDSKTYYDFSYCTIGDISLSQNQIDDVRMFEFYRFFETEFNGFDFSESTTREELKSNRWRIHSIGNQPDHYTIESDSTISKIKNRYNKYKRIFEEGSMTGEDIDLTPEVLESTYRQAKIGAEKTGDSEASSKFFQKELNYRRKSHGYYFWLKSNNENEDTPSLVERLYNAWLWSTNFILWFISGYGEKPKRVILSSVLAIGGFAVIYDLIWRFFPIEPPNNLSGPAGPWTLSAETFTAIILGVGSVDNTIIRGISYIEGFIGSMFIALFVLTITRAIRR